MKLGQTVHYICTESHKCQAAIISGMPEEGDLVMLHIMRPGDGGIEGQPVVERKPEVPYAHAGGQNVPGTWHHVNEHTSNSA